MKVGQTLTRSLGQLWEGLTRPAAAIQEPDQRRQAQLLASLLLLILALEVLAILQRVSMDVGVPLWQDRNFYVLLASGAMLLLPYWLSRTRHYRWAAALTAGLLSTIIFAIAVPDYDPDEIYFLHYLVLSVLFISMLLSLRATLILIAAHLAGLIVFPFLIDFPGVTPPIIYDGPLTFNVILSAIILLRSHHGAQLERDRQGLLRASERRFRALIENSADAITLIDPEGRAVYDSPAAPRLLGYGPSELMGRNVFELIHPDDAPPTLALFQHLLQAPQTRVHSLFRIRHKNNSWRWIEAVASNLLAEPSVQAVVVNYRDVTERQQAEAALRQKDDDLRAMTQQLWQAAKLATMGELAASIAHELNNPLATVSLRAESLLDHFAPTDPGRRELEIIGQEVERMSRLVANLLHSSRSQRSTSSLDVREEIESSLELMGAYLRRHQIAVKTGFAPDLPLVLADRQQLRQVFLNLFTNARDAMPRGGTLTIRVGVDEADRGGANPAPAHIAVTIADTGAGIPPEALSKVWEPFYTTKPEGQGTGLGLPICRRIVEEHGGTIRLASAPHQGTTVSLTLPVMRPSSVQAA
jgi:PAS domain S-box-containing protein